MNYLSNHWYGRLALKQAFWVNLVLILLIICTVEFCIHQFLNDDWQSLFIISVAYFVVFHVLVFIWQVTGVLRACDNNIKNYVSSGWTRAAQFAVIACFTGIMVWAVTLGQNLISYKYLLEEERNFASVKPDYQLNASDGELLIEGYLSPGITRQTRALLAEHKSVSKLILNSEGGNIFEARGLAKVVSENRLNTHVNEDCYSACTTVFIAGVKRTLGYEAKLGFHGYKINTKKLLPTSVSVEQEQEKDLNFFISKGVDKTFLEKAFATPFDQMWFPSQAELKQANIINP